MRRHGKPPARPAFPSRRFFSWRRINSPSRFNSASTRCSSASAAAAWPRCSRAASRGRPASSACSSSSASCPHLSDDPTFIKMFVEEAKLSARLNHPNIVHIFELGAVEGEYFISMEYIRGHDLVRDDARDLEGAGPAAPRAGRLHRPRGLPRARLRARPDRRERPPLGMIHRDVSPSNVMLSYEGAVKMLDFGIAKALGDARRADEERHAEGQVRVHGARADRGRQHRPPQRHLRRRHRAARGADRAAAVQGAERRSDDRARAPLRRAAAVAAEPGRAARAGRDRAQGAAARSGAALAATPPTWPTRWTTSCTRRASSPRTCSRSSTICSRPRAARRRRAPAASGPLSRGSTASGAGVIAVAHGAAGRRAPPRARTRCRSTPPASCRHRSSRSRSCRRRWLALVVLAGGGLRRLEVPRLPAARRRPRRPWPATRRGASTSS